jgi:hypothetical protein
MDVESGEDERARETGSTPQTGGEAGATNPESGSSPFARSTDHPVRPAALPGASRLVIELGERVARMQRELASSIVRSPGIADTMVRFNTTVAASLSNMVTTFNDRIRESLPPQFFDKSWMSSWAAELAEATARILLASWPPNLRPLADELRIGEVLDVLEFEGIPLYLVPRSATAKALLVANGTAARRAVIGRRFDSIIEDCQGVLDRCTNPETLAELTFIRAALAAIAAGHHAAGQALAANVLDTMIRTRFTQEQRTHLTSHRRTPSGDVLTEDMAVREAMVMLPIWAAHKTFERGSGDPVPYVFSRHGSVHAVSSRQYNKRNAAIALMLATSFVGFANGL